MRPALLLAITLVAVCAGAALGFFAGSAKPAPAVRTPGLSPGKPLAAASAPDTQNASAAPLSRTLEFVPRSFRDQAHAGTTLRDLRDQQDPRQQSRDMHELCAALDVPGVTGLLAALEQGVIDSPFERGLASNLMGRWAELDPRAAADFAVRLDARHHLSAIYTAMGTWAVSDIAAAKGWVLRARDREAHQDGVNAIVGFLAETDPQAAFTFLDELPPAEDRSFYVSSLFRSLAKKNPAQAAELAPRLATRALRQTAVREVTSAWGEKEPGKALAWYLQNASAQQADWQSEQTMEIILKKWTRTAPEEAAAFAGALPPGSTRTTIIGKLGASWGAVDPEAAAGWLQALPKSSESYRAFDNLIQSWTRSDPARAGEFILAQPADRSRDWLLGTLGNRWAETNPAAALAWAQQQGDPVIERQIAAEALGVMAAKDLPNAEKYFAQLKTPEARKNAIFAVANELTEREPERAAKWVMELSAKQAVGNAIEWPVQSWTWRDPDAVGAWLNQQAGGAQRDAAVGSYADALARKDAPAAAVWAGTIADDGLRRKRVKSVLETWAKKDRIAARAWVQAQRFAAAEEQEWAQAVERAGRE